MRQLSGTIRRLARAFHRASVSNPYTMSVIQYTVGLSLSDMFVQRYIEHREHDWRRTLSFTAVGVPLGLGNQKWILTLERLCPNNMTIRVAIIRMAIDQLTASPIVLVFELIFLKLLEGKGLEGVEKLVKNDLEDILKMNYIFWPPAMVINFWCVPLAHRILFMIVADFVWTSYISWRAHNYSLNK